MSLTFEQGLWAIVLTIAIIGAYFIGREVERAEHKAMLRRAEERQRSIEKARRAS